jgi:hypothetical protein
MAKHTPAPWVADPDDRDGMEWNIHVVEAARPHMRICFMTSDGPSEANAAFIVKAVNNHTGLVYALDRCMIALKNRDRNDYEDAAYALAVRVLDDVGPSGEKS